MYVAKMGLLTMLIFGLVLQNAVIGVTSRYLPTRAKTDKIGELRELIVQILDSSNESNYNDNNELHQQQQQNDSIGKNNNNRLINNNNNRLLLNNRDDNIDDISQIISPSQLQQQQDNTISNHKNRIINNNYTKALRAAFFGHNQYDIDRNNNKQY